VMKTINQNGRAQGTAHKAVRAGARTLSEAAAPGPRPALMVLFMLAACMVLLGAMAVGAQVQPPPAPWRGAGPTPCVGSDGGIYKCPPAPQTIAVRAGRLFDSKNGTMLAKQMIVLQGERITEVRPEGHVKIT